MPHKYRLAYTAVAVILLFNLAIGAHVYSRDAAEGRMAGYRQLRQFAQVLQLVRNRYVDADKVDYTNLVRGAMNGMLRELDPYSSYISPEEAAQMAERTQGEFGGIGVYMSPDLKIQGVMPGQPGHEAGLKSGDRVIRVNGESVVEMKLPQVIDLIKGEPGSKVKLTVYRPSTEETLTMEVERARIEIPSVREVSYLAPGIGYLNLDTFNAKTAEQLEAGLEKLRREQPLRGLILDLRHNPGGLLTSADAVCNYFVEAGKLIVYIEGRDPATRKDYKASGGAKYLDFPMVVLVDGLSASAAEIVAGCLKDHGRAVLVGEKTFGKGTVQDVIGLEDGGALRLTIAHYYTPSEQVIHGHGIEPDVVVDISDEDAVRIQLQHNRLPDDNGDGEDIPDLQLEKALEILRTQVAEAPPA